MIRHRGWLPYSEKKAQALAAMFETLMADGTLLSGDMLPHTRELETKYKVSSQTITRIRAILVERKLIRVVKGRGTFVR